MNILKKYRIAKNKSDTDFINHINKFSKVKECCLCGKKISSVCNSHIVPQFILKNISEDGCVAYGFILNNLGMAGMNEISGINNAHTFRLICKECDNNYFKDYENPNNLLDFDLIDSDVRLKMLCEMAIKNHLSHINMKYRLLVMKDMITNGKLAKMEENDEIRFPERIEINSHFKHIEKLTNCIKKSENPFEILLDITLNYQLHIATQTTINFAYDIKGNQLYKYDINTYANNLNWFHLVIFPLGDKTRIIFYIESDNDVKNLIHQFNDLSYDDKLHFILVALIANDEQFFMSPSFANVLKRDRKMVRLYRKTETNINYTKKMANFKKYKNYILLEKEGVICKK